MRDIDGNSHALEEYLQEQEAPESPEVAEEKKDLFDQLLRNPQYLWEALGPDAVVYPGWVHGKASEIRYDQMLAESLAELIERGDANADQRLGKFMRELAKAYIKRCVEVKS